MVLVDANALLDILTADPVWSAWSQGAIMEAATDGLAINPIIYSELAPHFERKGNSLLRWQTGRYNGCRCRTKQPGPRLKPLLAIAAEEACAHRRYLIFTLARMPKWMG